MDSMARASLPVAPFAVSFFAAGLLVRRSPKLSGTPV